MRFVRFLCNLGIFIVTYFMIFAVGVMAYTAVSWGVTSTEAVHFTSSDNSKVRFYDVWGFQFEDIGVSITSEPKPYTRNLFGGQGRWADVAINFVASIVKPIVVPHAQIDNLGEHRTTSIYEDLIYGDNDSARSGYYQNKTAAVTKSYTTVANKWEAFIELAVFNPPKTAHEDDYYGVEKLERDPSQLSAEAPGEGYYLKITEKHEDARKDATAVGDMYGVKIYYTTSENQNISYFAVVYQLTEDGTKLEEPKHVSDCKIFYDEKHLSSDDKAEILRGGVKVFDPIYERWVIDNNDALGNRMWQAIKYWNEKYDIYVTRFFETTAIQTSEVEKDGTPKLEYVILLNGNNKPMMKSSVLFLCVIEWIAMIVSAIFTIRYPITVIQARVTERRRRKKGDANTGVTI